MIALGGVRNGVTGTSFTDKVFIYDIFNETETVVDFDLGRRRQTSRGYRPESRYHTSATFIGQNHFLFNETAESGLKQILDGILMFGGDISSPNNNYLEDMWLLTLEKIVANKVFVLEHNKHEACIDILHPDKNLLNPWDWSCGRLAHVNSTMHCRWQDVVRKAWCQGHYQQSFLSPL